MSTMPMSPWLMEMDLVPIAGRVQMDPAMTKAAKRTAMESERVDVMAWLRFRRVFV